MSRCSVILPVYKGDLPGYLHAAMSSLRQQTLSPGEVLVVVDGPVPNELRLVISEFNDCLPVRLVELEKNVGLGAALNEGLASAKFPLVMRMDADDICEPNRIAIQVDYFESHPEIDILGGYATEIDASGAKGSVRVVPLTNSKIVSSLWRCPIIHPTVMYRKDKILNVGGYDPSLRRRQDYDLWFRCAEAGLIFSNLPESLLYYRFDAGSHHKQPTRLAFQQGLIGYKGCRSIGLSSWKAIACFIPFIRSMLPAGLQHFTYRLMKSIGPRQA